MHMVRVPERKRRLRIEPPSSGTDELRPNLVVVIAEETWQDRRAFKPDGIEGFRIQAQNFQDRGRDLSCFHEAVECAGLHSGIGYQKHDIGVIPREPTMFGLLLQ